MLWPATTSLPSPLRSVSDALLLLETTPCKVTLSRARCLCVSRAPERSPSARALERRCTNLSTRWVSKRGFYPHWFEDYVSTFAPDKALRSDVSCKFVFDERVVLKRVEEFKDFFLNNGSIRSQNLALIVIHVPYSLDSGHASLHLRAMSSRKLMRPLFGQPSSSIWVKLGSPQHGGVRRFYQNLLHAKFEAFMKSCFTSVASRKQLRVLMWCKVGHITLERLS